MTSEQKYADAVSVLTTRLEGWGVEDASARAHEFIRDMAQQGWRAHAGFDVRPPVKGMPVTEETRKRRAQEARDALAALNAKLTDTTEEPS